MSDMSYYKMAIWRQLCKRDFEESEARRTLQQAQPPAMCIMRKAELESEMDSMGEAAPRINDLFKEKV